MSARWNFLFGCTHGNTGFPMTLRRRASGGRQAGGRAETYVVCLDCGKEFPYDWDAMKIVWGKRREPRELAGEAAAERPLLSRRWSLRKT